MSRIHRSSQFWYTVTVVLGMTILACQGYPLPFVDDLYYLGAAFEMSEHNRLVNPLLKQYATLYPTASYYQYPPTYAYVLGYYLKCTGIGTGQLLLFQIVCWLLIALMLPRLARAIGHQQPYQISLVWMILLLAFLLGRGQRPDTLGVCFLVTGFWLVTHSGRWRWAAATVSWCLAFTTWPYLVFLAVGFGGAVLVVQGWKQLYEQAQSWKLFLSYSFSILAAVTASFLLFLMMIDGHLGQFLQVFRQHTGYAVDSPQTAYLLQSFILSKYENVRFAALYPLTILAIVLIWRDGEGISRLQKGMTLWFLLMVLGMTVFYSKTADFGFLLLGCLLFSIFQIHSAAIGNKVLRWLTWFLFAWLCLGAHHPHLVEWLNRDPGENIEAVRLQLHDRTYRRLLVDHFAARHLFSYRLPAGAECSNFSWSRPFGGYHLTDLQPGDVAVMAVSSVPEDHPRYPQAMQRLRIAGVSVGRSFNKPRLLVIYPDTRSPGLPESGITK